MDVLLGETDIERQIAISRLHTALLMHTLCIADNLAWLWQGEAILVGGSKGLIAWPPELLNFISVI